MSVQDELVGYIKNKIRENGIKLDVELNENTSLLNSGLFDSLAVIDLSIWIQEQIGAEVDLMTVEPQEEWDTMRDILAFIARHKQPTVGSAKIAAAESPQIGPTVEAGKVIEVEPVCFIAAAVPYAETITRQRFASNSFAKPRRVPGR